MNRPFREFVVPVGATPVLQGILNWLGYFKLPPMAHWPMPKDSLSLVTYVVAAGAAAIACLCKDQTRGRKTALIIGGVVALIISYVGYSLLTSIPPRSDLVIAFDVLGYASFFLTYISFGFLVGRVVKFFTAA